MWQNLLCPCAKPPKKHVIYVSKTRVFVKSTSQYELSRCCNINCAYLWMTLFLSSSEKPINYSHQTCVFLLALMLPRCNFERLAFHGYVIQERKIYFSPSYMSLRELSNAHLFQQFQIVRKAKQFLSKVKKDLV